MSQFEGLRLLKRYGRNKLTMELNREKVEQKTLVFETK